MATVIGTGAANEGTGSESYPLTAVDVREENGTRYVVSVTHDPESDKRYGFFVKGPRSSNGHQRYSGDSKPELLSMNTEILDKISLKNNQQSDYYTNSQSASSDSELWSQIINKSDVQNSVGVQSESVFDRIVENLSESALEEINRVGGYYIDSPAGTACDASVNEQPHRQIGVSGDMESELSTYEGGFIGGIVTALVGWHLGGGPVGGALGAIAGAIGGFIVTNVSDTNNFTMAVRDKDNCTWGFCNPSFEIYVSGLFMDEDTDLLKFDPPTSPDLPSIHFATTGTALDLGERRVIDVPDSL